MADIYKIAIGLSMTSNHAQVLSALSAGLLHAHVNAEKLQGSLSRIKLAVGGGLAIAGGVAILGGLKTMVDHAKELNHQLATLRTQGLNQAQIAMAQATARTTTTQVPGSTESGNVKLIGEAYSLFGLPDAMRINKQMAQYAQVIGSATGDFHKAEEGLYAMIRSGDLMGKLVNEHTHKADPDKLLAYFDIAAKMAAVTHGKVNAQTFLAIAQQGGPALANMSDDGMIAMMMAAQGMGGHRAGTAMTSLYQQMIGGTMTESKARELNRLGLLGGDYTVGKGGHVKFNRGALDTEFGTALGSDPLKASQLLIKAMEAHGLKGTEAQTKELFSLIGRQTAQRLLSDFIRNLPQMLAERGRIEGGQGLEAQARTRNETDLTTAEHNMSAAWKNLMEAIAGPNAIAAIGVMNRVTAGLNSLTDSVRGMNPDTLVNLAKGVAILGVSLTGAGAVALLAAIGPAGWVAAGIVGAAAAFIAFKEPFDAWVKAVTGMGTVLDGLDAKFNAAATAFGDFVSKVVDTIKNAFGGSRAIVNGGKPSGNLDDAMGLPGIQKQSFQGEGFRSLVQNAAFGGASGASSPFTEGVYQGVLRAMQELMGRGGSGGGGGGFQTASFVTGGGANDNFGGSSGVARALGRGGLGGAGGAIDRGGINSVGGSTQSRAHYLMGRLIAKGWSPEAAAAAAGNAVQESGVRPSGVTGDRGTAHGIFQWRLDRWQAAQAYMRAHPEKSAMDAQIDFFDLERKQRGGIQAQMHGYRSVEEANRAMKAFERYGDSSYGTRGANARGLLRSYHGTASKPVEAPTAGPPPRQPVMIQAHLTTNLDGRKVAHSVTQHQADAHLFPKKAGGMDTHGSFRSPGTPVTDAA
jgi:hypothetical protein